MITNDQPKREELSEISTSTMDGCDCFVLTHETTIGKNPVDSTTYLAKAIAEAENVFDYDQAFVNVREDIKK